MQTTNVRYILKESVKVVSLDPECTKNLNIHRSPTKNIFLDIISKNDFSYHVVLFMENGQVVRCYIPHKAENLIEIYNSEELLDGRFNAVCNWVNGNPVINSAI